MTANPLSERDTNAQPTEQTDNTTKNDNTKYISPSDNILSPASQKLADFRSKHSNHGSVNSDESINPISRKILTRIQQAYPQEQVTVRDNDGTKREDGSDIVTERADSDNNGVKPAAGGNTFFNNRDTSTRHSLAEKRSWFKRAFNVTTHCKCGAKMEKDVGCPVYAAELHGECE